MKIYVKYNTLQYHLNQISRQSVIQLAYWNQRHRGLSMQTLTWHVEGAAQLMSHTSGVPGIPRQGGGGASDLDEQGGCVQWRIQDLHKKKGWAEKSVRVAHRVCAKRTARVSARASYGWGPGARLRAPGGVLGQSPCRGPRGRSPRKLSSFQQIGGGDYLYFIFLYHLLSLLTTILKALIC